MGEMVGSLCQCVVSALRSKRDLILENAALRHQLMVLKRQSKAPPIPVPAEPDPEHSDYRLERPPGPIPLKHRKLVTEDGVLRPQRDAGSRHPNEGPKDQKEP